jgi:hypothetical protein
MAATCNLAFVIRALQIDSVLNLSIAPTLGAAKHLLGLYRLGVSTQSCLRCFIVDDQTLGS